MQRFNLTQFGMGLDTTRNPTQIPPGFARISRNLLHNRQDIRAELRKGIDRVNLTRPSANPVYGLYEFIKNNGTTKLLQLVNGALSSWTIGGTTNTSVKTGLNTSGPIGITTALNFCIIADNRATNYITDGTSANTYTLGVAAPTETMTVTATAGGAMTQGTYKYDYARYSSTTGEYSAPQGTQVSGTLTGGNNKFTLTQAAIAVSGQFDKIQIYRSKLNTSGPLYQLGTPITIASFNSGFIDNNADTALTVLSTVHTNPGGASSVNQVEAGTDVVFHKGRLHIIGLTGVRSRHRWSQANTYTFDNTTSARHDVEPDDGDFLWRAFSYNGFLILMKDRSIHILGGDIDENTFTWSVASPRSAGIGAYCPWTAVPTPLGIIFLGENGVYVYQPGMTQPLRISETIQTTIEGLDFSRRLLFVGGYNPTERCYLLSVTPNGNTTNTLTYAYFIDTGYWSEWQYAGGQISPATFALIHNSSSRLRYFFGDANGYIYEGDTATGSDGVTSGTQSGNVTSGTATSLTDSSATFRISGDGLLGISATVQNSTTFETQQITANSSTSLTTNTWTTTPATQSYYVGALDMQLSLARLDLGEAGLKRFYRMNIEFQAQTHSVPLMVGYTLDNDTQPTTVTSTTQNGVFRASIQINRTGVGISPYIRSFGTSDPLTILRIEIDYDILTTRLPRN